MADRWQDAMDYARKRLLSEGWVADRGPQPVTLKKLKLNGSMKTYKIF